MIVKISIGNDEVEFDVPEERLNLFLGVDSDIIWKMYFQSPIAMLIANLEKE